MRWHPNVNIGKETDSRMKRINVAYPLVCQHLGACERVGAYRTYQSAKPGSCFLNSTGIPGSDPHAQRLPSPAKPVCNARCAQSV